MIILATAALLRRLAVISDAEVLVIVQKHCATCHTQKVDARKFSRSAEKYNSGICRRPQETCCGHLRADCAEQGDATRQPDRYDRSGTRCAGPVAEGAALSDAVKPFGVFATFRDRRIRAFVGQLSAILALSLGYGLKLSEVATLAQDGGAIVLFIFVSAPVQVALLALGGQFERKRRGISRLQAAAPRRGDNCRCWCGRADCHRGYRELARRSQHCRPLPERYVPGGHSRQPVAFAAVRRDDPHSDRRGNACFAAFYFKAG